MKKYIAFLRAINVGGRNVKMEELKGIFIQQGFNNVETFIASGNVIFDFISGKSDKLENKIEKFLSVKLGYEVAVFLRTNKEIEDIINNSPFPKSSIENAKAYNIAFIKKQLNAQSQGILADLKTEIDDLKSKGREVFWLCKVKQSDSKFSNAVFERKLKIDATFRGMKTILKLVEKYPSL